MISKKLVAFLTPAILLASIVGVAVASSLVSNGGFESGYSDWTFVDVDVVGSGTWAPS